MKRKLNLLVAGLILAATSSAVATVRYVNINSAHPTPPYTNWATAATNIQDAVDAAGAGDEIVVTNGIYATPGLAEIETATNIVAVDKPLTVRSVNGPDFTVIDGGGNYACAYLTNDAVMVGFTLTNGSAFYNGGGVYCESTSAVLSNCVLSGNWGGGAYGGTLNNCTLTGNTALDGGGAAYCTLNNCTLTGNFTDGKNSAGGGALESTLNNCTLTGNSAFGEYSGAGGGASGCTLNNCALTGNTALYGGGANSCTLNNCTLTGNSASCGGGAYSCTLNNCIVYFNSDTNGGNYDPSCTLNYGCTTPLPTNGVGNISADPQLASAWYLSAQSPCIGAGSPAYASGTDIDGKPWANPPSIGCDEYHAGAVTGPLTVSLTATLTNVAKGFPVGLTAVIGGRTDLSVWEFGDSLVEVNEPYTSHTWTVPGDYLVALWAFNDSYPEGVSATLSIHVEEGLHYVAASNGNPVAPYTSWATAAKNIQDAVDVAPPGATVFVTNGVYAAGSWVDPYGVTNCVVVDTPLTLQSVNGPNVTIINGGGAVRCLYLANDAVLVGFTLTNGVDVYQGGGVYCESTSAVLSNCVLSGNLASQGSGGGAFGGTLNNCTLTSNSASPGGGAWGCTLNNCTLTGNSGGGADGCTLNNCAVSGNTGDGADYSTLNNCTITGNSGWGASSATLNNCIVYFNSDPNGGNYDPSSTLNYCCTTPMPTNGVGNISADPHLASASHLSAESPCIGAGSATYTSGTDIDGDAWANPPSIGCEEYHVGAVTGPLTASLTAAFTNVATGFPVGLTAFIEGRTGLSVWDFGDGSVEVNEPYTSHTWTAPGDYLVGLWAFNESYPEGVSATLTIHVVEHPVQYVALASTNPVAPYVSWATAAKNIQDAVNVAPPGATVFVTNGTYACVTVNTPLTVQSVNGPGVTAINGGGTDECVYLTNNAVLVGFTLTSGNVVAGYRSGGGVYCQSTSAVVSNCVLTGNRAWLGGGAYGGTLNNCTLTGNSSLEGGGADGSTLNNCTLTGNSSFLGGGADGGTLNNCTLTGNSANWGGGANGGTLNNCTLTGNSANGYYGVLGDYLGGLGGGANGCTLNNCIVYFNSDTNGGNYDPSSTLNYCCTTPMPTNGVGNITNAPLFVNYAGGNLRLQSNSPCINSGNNTYVVGSTDLDGNPRIVGGTVDIGAYEYQTPLSMISYAWLQHYGLPINTNTDTADLDGTGMNLYQDWIAGLNPTNAQSVLQMTSATAANNPAGLVVTWESVSGIMYFLQSSTNLAAQPAFSTIQSNIVGQAGTTSYTDTNAVGSGPYFYRVGVGN
jgi:hypothetical protein